LVEVGHRDSPVIVLLSGVEPLIVGEDDVEVGFGLDLGIWKRKVK